MALGDLGVLPSYLRSRGQKAQHDEHPSEDGGGAKSPYGFESQLPTRVSPVLTYLFHSIDQGVAYPAELFSAGISGEVSARLRFNDRGEWDEAASELSVTGRAARFFRVYLLGRLRRIFAEPVPPNLWKTEPHAIVLEARFVFDIVAPETVIGAQVGPQYAPSADPTRFSEKDTDGGQSVESRLIAGRQGMYGRRFVFYRVHLASPLDWKLGPIAGYGLLPTIGIDPGWVADKISDLWHHREKPDPLMKYRESPDW
jgi:hypothetical protein